MTVFSGLNSSLPPRRMGAGARTLGATVARLDAATLAVERLGHALPLRALYDTLRPLLEAPLDLSVLATTLDRADRRAARSPRDPEPGRPVLPGTTSTLSASGQRAWRAPDPSTPRSPLPGSTVTPRRNTGPGAFQDVPRPAGMSFSEPSAPSWTQAGFEQALATTKLRNPFESETDPPLPAVLPGSAASSARSRDRGTIPARPPSRSARLDPTVPADNGVRPVISHDSPAAAPPRLPVHSSSTPVGQATALGSPVETSAPRPPATHETSIGTEPTSFGALGELVRRVEQLSENTATAPTVATPAPAPLTTVDESMDALEEALEVLIRRDAERYGITGWSS